MNQLKQKKVNISTISLGSNLWNKKDNLNKAIKEIWDIASIEAISSFIETKFWTPPTPSVQAATADWEYNSLPNYINAIIKISTDLSPLDLLNKLLEIENKLWRIRKEKWWPRIIDLDIITYNKEKIDLPNLKIPHPYAKERDFVLKPLQEIDREIMEWLIKN